MGMPSGTDLEPRQISSTSLEGSEELRNLSKSFWSARISTKLSEQQAHEHNKKFIPYLDLARLPLWSEEDEDPIVEKPIDDGFFEEKLG